MPWSNQSGGGGGRRGGGDGPWGSPPSGGGGGGGGQNGGTPPDLEDILRRGQDRLKNALPGGGGSRFLIPLVLVAAVGLWLMQCFYQVEPDEVGVELLFGKAKAELSEPGIHFHFWPIETVEKPALLRENKEFIGTGQRTGTRTSTRDPSLMLSGDQNIIDIDFTVLWRIKDPAAYLFRVRDQQHIVRVVAESAMRDVVGRTNAEEVRTEQRQQVEQSVQELIQKTLDEYQAGIRITGVKMERADPPGQVADAFEEVQRAQQDQDKFQQQAQAYANKKLGDARGQASQITEAALAYASRVVAEADGEAQRFISVYEEYSKAKDVTRKRLFLETMERVLKGSNKVIMERNAGGGVVPYLPLPEVAKRAKEGN